MKKFISLFAFLFVHAGLVAQTVPQQIIFEGLTGNQLLDSLAVHYYPKTVLNYNNARDQMFSYIYNEDGVVYCIYTGDTILIDEGEPNPRTIANNHSPNWNTEHIYPQSKGAQSGFSNSDLHHLQPTRADVNSSRGNSPFGFVPDELVSNWWGPDGSQTTQPAGDLSLYSRAMGSSRFQPRHEMKGNSARAVFYFFTVYRDQAIEADPSFFSSMMEDLRVFHNENQVNLLEAERNEAIALIQGNINPFILDTTLVRRAYFENYDPEIIVDGNYFVDFESASKTGYASGIASLNGLAWNFDEALVGTEANDLKIGARSARFRTLAKMEMVDQLTSGAGTISFLYGRSNFSSDRTGVAPVLVTEIEVDGVWEQVGENIDLDGIDTLTEFRVDVQQPGPVRVRIRTISGTSGRRFNIDNIYITEVNELELAQSVSGNAGWRMFTSPTQNTTIADMLRGNIFTQGFPGADNASSELDPNVYLYNAFSGNFEVLSSLEYQLTAGEGFIVWIFPENKNAGAFSSIPEINIELKGFENSEQNLSLLYNGSLEHGGWNLIGNPFAGDYPVAELGLLQDESLNNYVYIWDAAADDYVIYSAADQEAVISSFQSFFVKADGIGTELFFDRNEITSGGQFYKAVSEPARAVLYLEKEGRKSELRIILDNEGTEEFTNRDAYRLMPLNSSYSVIYAIKGEESAAIAHYPLDFGDEPYRIPIGFGSTSAGTALLDADLSQFPSGWNLYLEKVSSGNLTLLSGEPKEVMIDMTLKLVENGNQPTAPVMPVRSAKGSDSYNLIISKDVLTSGETTDLQTPRQFALQQNYPNPFNPATLIRYELRDAGNVKLEVFDMIGRRVAVLVDGVKEAGTHEVRFNAESFSSGVYIYRLTDGSRTAVRQMTLIK